MIPQFPCSYTVADVNECSSDPCKNKANCTDEVGWYNCTCTAGYTGVHCETGGSVGTTALVWLGTHEYIVRQVGQWVHM